jgi:hypothetical protein
VPAELPDVTESTSEGTGRFVILRDLAIFGLKVLLDGLKDVILIQIAAVAAGLDVLFPGKRRGHRFYSVLRAAERFDRWLNLYGAVERATAQNQGLFEASVAGADNLLGKLESIVTGRDERPGAPKGQAQRTPREPGDPRYPNEPASKPKQRERPAPGPKPGPPDR